MSDMTKAELEAELRQARDKICYCECKNKELQERLSAIVAPVQCDTYAEAVRAYGKQSQLVMAMEEMSELTKELSKNLRGADNSKALAEEIADVEIMLEQLKVIFRNRALVDRIRAGKLGPPVRPHYGRSAGMSGAELHKEATPSPVTGG